MCPGSRVVVQIGQIGPNSAHPRIRRFLSLTMRGWAPFWRPNLAYGHTFSTRQESKKSCIGSKDFAALLRPGCGLLRILNKKNEKYTMVNGGRLFITIVPRAYVFLISKNCLRGPQNGPGAVPRSPETPRNSPTLRDRWLWPTFNTFE